MVYCFLGFLGFFFFFFLVLFFSFLYLIFASDVSFSLRQSSLDGWFEKLNIESHWMRCLTNSSRFRPASVPDLCPPLCQTPMSLRFSIRLQSSHFSLMYDGELIVNSPTLIYKDIKLPLGAVWKIDVMFSGVGWDETVVRCSRAFGA